MAKKQALKIQPAAAMKMLPAKAGTCCMCATAHGEHDAHNLQSLFYAVRFMRKYGREPTWGDAVAHLTPEQQATWKGVAVQMLARHGREWTEPADGKRIAEPYAMNE